MDDVISRLPRDLLVSILSRLTFEEAMLTSFLSRHWEKLWTFYRGNLDFRVSNKLERNESSKYVRSVNKVMDTLEQVEGGYILDSFTIRFNLCPGNSRSVDRWVRFPLETRRVKSLIFEDYINLCHCGCRHIPGYDFPPLECFSSQHRSNIRSLTSICFKSVNLSGEAIEHFISNCPLLQSLEVIKSRKPLVHLRVSGATLVLRHLCIQGCSDLTHVELSAPNLVSLSYQGDDDGTTKVIFDIQNVPKLVRYTIRIDSNYPCVTGLALGLLTRFSHVHTLELNIYSLSKDAGNFIKLSEITSVKHITMTFHGMSCRCILAWTPLLRAFPALQKLTLNMIFRFRDGIEEIERLQESLPSNKNKHLEELEFIGFGGSRDDFEMVMHFLKNTGKALKKIRLDCNGGGFHPRLKPIVKDRVDAGQKNAMELIQIVPKEVHLTIF